MRQIFLIVFFLVAGLGAFTGCSNNVDLSFPLKEGAKWNYQFTTPEMRPGTVSKLVIGNLPVREINGRKLLPQHIQLFYEGGNKPAREWGIFLAEDSEGIYGFAPDKNSKDKFSAKYYIVKYPVKVGAAWTTTTAFSDYPKLMATSTVESVSESVTVPAGTFENCIKIKIDAVPDESTGRSRIFPSGQTLVQANIWFAPKVGIVKAVATSSLFGRSDDSNSLATYAIQLESYLN